MLDFIKEKKNCVGCTACYAICPVDCIEMIPDEEGFIYPVASDKCIHCGMCQRICPIFNHETPPEVEEQQSFAMVTKDSKVWRRSASGGAFSEICRAWDQGDTMFVGAAWDGFEVHHLCVDGFDQLEKICKSKYVQSNMGSCFNMIHASLKKGKKVVFCGTPCQVEGLKRFLHKDYETLLLIDFICHGVGSPSVFKACIKNMEKQFGQEILSYEFRAKGKVYQTDYLQKITFKDSKELFLSKDPYIKLFLSQNCLRPSCGENCLYRCAERQSDITIADFKGLTEVFEKLKGTKRNYSSVILNTPKGKKLLPLLQSYMDVIPCGIEQIKKRNPLFYKQTWFSKTRDEFFADFKVDQNASILKWSVTAEVYKQSLKRKLYDILPVKARKVLNQISDRK